MNWGDLFKNANKSASVAFIEFSSLGLRLGLLVELGTR